MITVSLVSHGHGALIGDLVARLTEFPEVNEIILTLNTPESVSPYLLHATKIINNKFSEGFAANHNAAFKLCRSPYFCVLNPDIELSENPFPQLLACMSENHAGLTAPLVFSPELKVEDSFRYFPTPISLIKKALKISDGRCRVSPGGGMFFTDWTAGMFMLFDSHVFKAIDGFDQNFFLYYEDVDICVRLWKNGYRVVACPLVSVVHAARRDSHRNWRYTRWHLASMGRYFIKHYGRLPKTERCET